MPHRIGWWENFNRKAQPISWQKHTNPSPRFPYVRFAQFHHHQAHFKCISCVFRVYFVWVKSKCFCAACTKWCGNSVVFLEKKNIFRLCFHPILTENYVKFNIVWKRLCRHNFCHRSKMGRQNVACVAYSSSFLSKNCRIQCAFRVVLQFFFLLAVVPYKFFLKMLFSQWHLSEHRLRTLFSSSLSKQVELVDCLRAN